MQALLKVDSGEKSSGKPYSILVKFIYLGQCEGRQEELKKKYSMMVTGKIPMIRKNGLVDRVYICRVCGKQGIRTSLMKHIKAILIASVE